MSDKKFTEKELVSFGKFLLSKERKDNFKNNIGFRKGRLKERLMYVTDSDIENWKQKEIDNKKNTNES